MNAQIETLEDLAEILASLRVKKDRKIVQCHGVFDLLHIGYIRYLKQAKKLGDVLVVTLTPDKYVNKGPHRPAFAEDLRIEAIAALECVDFVAVNKWPTATETIRLLKPDVYAKGVEFRDKKTEEILREEAAIEEIGGQVKFIDDITSSSSSLINRYLEIFPEKTRNYLETFKGKHSIEEIVQYLEELRSLKVLVVGEAIIDEYQYCDAIGKSSKDPTLVVKYLSKEMFAGGALAISNHVASFCGNIELLTVLGEENTQEDFVRQHLKPNVKVTILYKENAPTILKRRIVDRFSLTKFLEIYKIEDRELNETENLALMEVLTDRLRKYDVVITADFGHGMLTKDAIDILCQEARFLAANTQVNAGNRGINSISKYPNADLICLNEKEVRLEIRDQQGGIREIVDELYKRLNCDRILVTRGASGNLGFKKEEGFFEAPALTTKVVDIVGSGDAVFSLSSLCAARKMPMEIICFVANVVGAEATGIMGNRTSMEHTSLLRHIRSLLR